MNPQPLYVYVGTYTRSQNEGIYIYKLDRGSGSLQFIRNTGGDAYPSFLTIHKHKPYLYAVNEAAVFGRNGAVAAYSIATDTGNLTLINRTSSAGAGPCYVSIDPTGRFVLTANYSSGSVAVLPIRNDGSLGAAAQMVQHQGTGKDPKRQAGPHAHSIAASPSARHIFAADLGLDKVMIYTLDLDLGWLMPHSTPWVQTRPGSGPRHFTFHPNGRVMYIISELDSNIYVYNYDSAQGSLTLLQTVSALPPGFAGVSWAADIHLHPSGLFLYGSNRGHDSIAIFHVAEDTGMLTPAGHCSTKGAYPRNFALTPAGDLLLAANQNSDTIVTFWVNQKTGALEATGHITRVPKPVCIQLLQV